MRASVGITTKIFAISVSVLLLLIVIAISTHLKIRNINAEVKYLAKHILPIVNVIDHATIAMLEQEIHIERLLKLYHSAETNTAAIEHEKQKLEQDFKQANAGLLSAQQQLNTAIEAIPEWLNNSLSSDTSKQLEAVRLANQTYHETSLNLFQDEEHNNAKQLKRRELALQSVESRLNQEAELVIEQLQSFAITTAQQAEKHQTTVLFQNLALTLLAIILGLVYSGILARKLSQPIRELNRQVSHALNNNDLATVQASSHDEVALLTDRFNLALATLRRSEQFKDMFGQYLDPRLIAQLESNLDDVNLKGERQKVTVIFSDLEGLSTDTGKLAPEQLVTLINQYLEFQLEASSAYRGLLNCTLTEILGFWTHPFSEQQMQCQQAAHMLLAQLQGLTKFRLHLQQHFPEFDFTNQLDLRAGLTSGDLIVANMGPSGARAFTVIGDEVNAASRLKGVARFFSVNAVISADIAHALSDEFVIRPLGWVKVPGKDDAIQTWQLINYKNSMSASELSNVVQFKQAYTHFEQGQYEQAEQLFRQCLSNSAPDNVIQRFIAQCQLFTTQEPAPETPFYWEIGQK